MPKFQKRLIVCLLAMVGLVVLLASYQRVHGINQLKARVHDIEDQGDSMDIAKLVPALIPDADNAVVALLALTNRLNGLGSLLRSRPSGTQLTVGGDLTNVFGLSEWSYTDRDPITFDSTERTNDWTGFMADFAMQTNLLKDVLSALDRPGFNCGHRAEDGFHKLPMKIYMVSRNVEKLLVAGAYYHVRKGELRSAHRCLIGLARLISGFENDRLLIGQLIRLAIIDGAYFAMWQALQVEGWKDAELAAWNRHWGQWDLAEDMLKAGKLERAMTVDYYELLGGKTGTAELRRKQWKQAWDAMGLGIGIERTKFNEHVVVPLWYFVWQEQDCCRALDSWQRVIGLQQLAVTDGWRAAEDQFLGQNGRIMPAWARASNDDLNWFDENRFLFSSFSMLNPEGQARKTMAVSAMQRLLQTAIAIRRFELRHQRVPSALIELEPELISEVPLDPMDLKPLRYRSDGKHWSLYSVGVNGEDDGGVCPKGDGSKVKGLRGGADIIWPQAAGE